ncbi:DUF2946 family protein [Rhodoferax sp. PAMC 29310]|uniref:DUF2946 family protein n=1 Tax=Rhodoferax sp. PAMC 29310 TaxID=2822760 RepID=UPI001B319091|nr:DUF2946 family protein [Rhodoferax sp. PAMC 29310]
MQFLRNAHHLARFVLAWFVLTLGVAIASPVVHPRVMELICSDAGVVKLVVQGEADGGLVKNHTLECPMCIMGGGAPLVQSGSPLPAERVTAAYTLPLVTAPTAVSRTGPPPARGPPWGA